MSERISATTRGRTRAGVGAGDASRLGSGPALRLAPLALLAFVLLSLAGCGAVGAIVHPGGAAAPKTASAPKTTESPKTAKSPKTTETSAADEKRAADAPKNTKKPKAAKSGTLQEAREQMVLAPREPYWPARLGQLYVAADSLKQGEAALETALARDHGYAPALSQLSRLWYQSGRHAQAVQRIEAARAEQTAAGGSLPAEVLAGLALHYDALGRPDLATATMAALPRPERERAGSADVYLLLRGAEPNAASEPAKSDVHENPKSAASRNNYGITRLRAGDPEEARRAFMEAIDLDPKRAGPYYNLAILEKYYLFDDAAAGKWLARYWERAIDDPDNLAAAIGGRAAPVAEGDKP